MREFMVTIVNTRTGTVNGRHYLTRTHALDAVTDSARTAIEDGGIHVRHMTAHVTWRPAANGPETIWFYGPDEIAHYLQPFLADRELWEIENTPDCESV